MNKKAKKIFGTILGFFSFIALASCNSFCTVEDTSNFRYAYDPINTSFYTTKESAYNDIASDFVSSTGISEENFSFESMYFAYGFNDDEIVRYNEDLEGFEEKLFNIYNESLISINAGELVIKAKANEEDTELTTYSMYIGINSFNVDLIETKDTYNYLVPSYDFFNEFDKKTLSLLIENYNLKNKNNAISEDFSNLSYELLYGYSYENYNSYFNETDETKKEVLLEELQKEREENSLLANYGYLKHYFLTTDSEGNETVDYYGYIKKWNDEIALTIGSKNAMSSNYLYYYQKNLDSKVSNVKTCITVNDGYYGNLSDDPLNKTVHISAKALDFYEGWGEAFTKHGFLEGLLVYPIAIGVENMSHAFGMNGWGQISAVLLMTLIIRTLFMVVTLPSTISQQKMTALQPELAKLQQKYPNAQTNQYDKQRLAQAQMALYKKHKVHPFRSMLVLIIQFPLFICVWNAMNGSASLSSDAVLGLNLSDSIWNVLSNFNNWPGNAGWWTALVLILLMSASQIFAMLLPNLVNKKRTKNVAKTVKSETADQNQKTMKYFQWGMTIMIIIMGFQLPAAMGVYWFAGALFSILQTLTINLISNRKNKKNNN